MVDYNNKTMIEGTPVFDAKERSHRLSGYLQDLRDRLHGAIQQHKNVVQSSMQLLKEVGDVSGMLHSKETAPQMPPTKVRRLIMGFETVSVPNPSDLAGDRALLVEFEALNESQILRESIMSFKRAGESLENVLATLEKSQASQLSSKPEGNQFSLKPQASHLSIRRNLREKIEAFNKGEKLVDNSRHFTNCFSTSCSVKHTPFEACEVPRIASKTNSGYEGDVDTEAEFPESRLPTK